MTTASGLRSEWLVKPRMQYRNFGFSDVVTLCTKLVNLNLLLLLYFFSYPKN